MIIPKKVRRRRRNQSSPNPELPSERNRFISIPSISDRAEKRRKLRYTGRDYGLSLFVIYFRPLPLLLSPEKKVFPRPSLNSSLVYACESEEGEGGKLGVVFIFRLLLFQTPHGFMLYAPFLSLFFLICHNM
jgi:hypothetical protein